MAKAAETRKIGNGAMPGAGASHVAVGAESGVAPAVAAAAVVADERDTAPETPAARAKAEGQGGWQVGKAARAASVAAVVQDASSVWMAPQALSRWEKNPRDNDRNVPNVAASIERFGFVNPIVVWRAADRMVAGDTRLKAMRQLMAEHGPGFTARGAPGPGLVRVVFHDFADEDEANLYALADNRLNELSPWNAKRLDEVLSNYDDEDRAIAGFAPEKVAEGTELEVRSVDVEALTSETFWLTVRGPLPKQPEVLDMLRRALGGVDGVEVQFGTG